MFGIDFLIVILYFALVIGIGIYFSKEKDNTSQYFLANRNLGWFVIGASLFASNIGSEHLVGLAEGGYIRGIIESQFEILAAFCLLLLGWLFVPFYMKSGVTTMPEFLEKRFSPSARMYLSVVSIVAYVITKISVTIFAGAIVIQSLLGLDFWIGAIIVVVLTGVYTIMGGLKAVVYTDAVQMFLLIGGALLVTIFGLEEVGGWNNLSASAGDGFLSLWRSASHPEFPWTAILFGAPILGIWYWCTDQFIVQRVLAAKNQSTARKATIFAGFLKMAPMFIFLIPGVIAYSLHNDPNSSFYLLESKATLPELIKHLLPVGVRGLVAAGLLAALMSSLSSVFNSCSTLLTIDIYQKINPKANQKSLVGFGQISTIILVLIGILWIPLQSTLSEGGLFKYIQSIQAYISPPIAAAFLLGIFIKRINSSGVMAAFIVGAIFGVFRLSMEFVTEDISEAQANVKQYIKYDKNTKAYNDDIKIIEERINKAKKKKYEVISQINSNKLETVNFRSLESITAEYDKIIEENTKSLNELKAMFGEPFTDSKPDTTILADNSQLIKFEKEGTWEEGETFTDLNKNDKFDNKTTYLEDNQNILLASSFFNKECFEDELGNSIWEEGETFIDCDSESNLCEGDKGWNSSMGNGKWNKGEKFTDLPDGSWSIQEDLNPNFIYKLAKMNFLHFALMLFLICSIVMILVSLLTKAPNYEKIKDLVYNRNSQQEEGEYVSTTAFKKSEDKMLSIILVLIVVILWVAFI